MIEFPIDQFQFHNYLPAKNIIEFFNKTILSVSFKLLSCINLVLKLHIFNRNAVINLLEKIDILGLGCGFRRVLRFFQWQVLTRRAIFCLGFSVYFYWIKTCWCVLCCDGRFLCSGNILFYISTSLYYWVLNHFIGLYCFLYHDPYRVTQQYVHEDII